MIRVILQGRTGNNLFQYALGRHLAVRHNTRLELDLSWAGPDTQQMKELERLPIQAALVRKWPSIKKGIRRLGGPGPEFWHRGPVYQKTGGGPGFRPEVLDLPDGVLLVGFYHHEGYFSTIAETLRQELSMNAIHLPDSSTATLDLIQRHRMVSIHVRRGDYVRIQGTQCVPENYHQAAVAHLRKHFEDLEFLVFSDDIPWCRKAFSGPEFHFCDHPEAANDPFHDLKLMAACEHHIVMNSTYSWWGAWLNPSATKMVIAPKMWMSKIPATEVMPTSWVLI